MLASTLASPKRKNNRGRKPERLYDCGKYGRLSRSQIATVAGISRAAVAQRLKAGYVGERLCVTQKAGIAKRGVVCRATMVAAVRIAQRFHGRVPSLEEIMRAHPMAKDTARTWQRVITRVLEEAA